MQGSPSPPLEGELLASPHPPPRLRRQQKLRADESLSSTGLLAGDDDSTRGAALEAEGGDRPALLTLGDELQASLLRREARALRRAAKQQQRDGDATAPSQAVSSPPQEEGLVVEPLATPIIELEVAPLPLTLMPVPPILIPATLPTPTPAARMRERERKYTRGIAHSAIRRASFDASASETMAALAPRPLKPIIARPWTALTAGEEEGAGLSLFPSSAGSLFPGSAGSLLPTRLVTETRAWVSRRRRHSHSGGTAVTSGGTAATSGGTAAISGSSATSSSPPASPPSHAQFGAGTLAPHPLRVCEARREALDAAEIASARAAGAFVGADAPPGAPAAAAERLYSAGLSAVARRAALGRAGPPAHCTFAPDIDENSRRLAAAAGARGAQPASRHERLYAQAQARRDSRAALRAAMQAADVSLTFAPAIDEHSRRLAMAARAAAAAELLPAASAAGHSLTPPPLDTGAPRAPAPAAAPGTPPAAQRLYEAALASAQRKAALPAAADAEASARAATACVLPFSRLLLSRGGEPAGEAGGSLGSSPSRASRRDSPAQREALALERALTGCTFSPAINAARGAHARAPAQAPAQAQPAAAALSSAARLHAHGAAYEQRRAARAAAALASELQEATFTPLLDAHSAALASRRAAAAGEGSSGGEPPHAGALTPRLAVSSRLFADAARGATRLAAAREAAAAALTAACTFSPAVTPSAGSAAAAAGSPPVFDRLHEAAAAALSARAAAAAAAAAARAAAEAAAARSSSSLACAPRRPLGAAAVARAWGSAAAAAPSGDPQRLPAHQRLCPRPASAAAACGPRGIAPPPPPRPLTASSRDVWGELASDRKDVAKLRAISAALEDALCTAVPSRAPPPHLRTADIYSAVVQQVQQELAEGGASVRAQAQAQVIGGAPRAAAGGVHERLFRGCSCTQAVAAASGAASAATAIDSEAPELTATGGGCST